MPDNPIYERARQLGGPSAVPELSDGDVFSLPVFEEVFDGGHWEKASGKVRLRYPTFGDEVEIERLSVINGGTLLARAQASIMVCLEAAPASWWRPSLKEGSDPFPAPDRLPCSPEVVGLFTRWIAWRDSFRRKDDAPPGAGAE